MLFSTKAEYALLAMMELVKEKGNGLLTSAEIAKRGGIPPKYLPQIMLVLGKAGFVKTLRGYGGGVKLALGAEDVPILDILTAVEDSISLYRCTDNNVAKSKACAKEKTCTVRQLLSLAQKKCFSVLKKKRLSDLVKN